MRKVDSNIPIPKRDKYEFVLMKKVGQSIFYPTSEVSRGCIANAAFVYGKRSGRRYSTQKVKGGTRVWRIK